jgi:hypothetical protein
MAALLHMIIVIVVVVVVKVVVRNIDISSSINRGNADYTNRIWHTIAMNGGHWRIC